jgi:hypothetical protein
VTFALGARSLSFCAHVDPRMMAVAKLAISLSTQDFGFTQEQSRTLAQEADAVRKGVSHTMHSHHLIGPPYASAGFSGAVDAVPWSGGKFVWDWALIYPVAAAFRAASLQLKEPITWGGNWGRLMSEIPGDDAAAMKAAQNSWDGPHFELGRN